MNPLCVWSKPIRIVALFTIMTSLPVSAGTDFTGMSDVEVLMHEDRSAGLTEFRRRAKDYPPAKVHAIEQEYLQSKMTPRERPVPRADELIQSIGTEDNVVKRAALFAALRERFAGATEADQTTIKTAYLLAWSATPYSTEDTDSLLRYREFARDAGVYLRTEEELLPVLVDRCLDIDTPDRYALFFSSLAAAQTTLGERTAARVVAAYNEMNAPQENGVAGRVEHADVLKAHQVLGRCGQAGVDAVLALGTAELEQGVWAFQLNTSPEAEAHLWALYERVPADHDARRLRILRALSNKLGIEEGYADRLDRFRAELSEYLILPEGKVNVRDIEHAVVLAQDTKDSFYLPKLEALEGEIAVLDPGEMEFPGMEDRIEEALENLRGHFQAAKVRLRPDAAAAGTEG